MRWLAAQLEVPASTLSTWLHGVAPAPEDLSTRLEEALSLRPGTLTSKDI